jgi:mannose-6-phosphate isomerase-like protein (cupin superfamily)
VLIVDLNSIQPITGFEGTQIKQIFHPHNTMLGIRYSMVQCSVEPGRKSKPHKLKSAEVYFIINGEGVLHIDDESCQVRKNQAIYVPPYSRQFIQNTGKIPLEFLCIVDPAWRQEDEIVE